VSGADARAGGWPAAPSERPPLLVVQIGPPESLDGGPAVHRTLQPCRALGELPDLTVVSGFSLSPALYSQGLLLAADVLVLREIADPDLLPIIAARRRQGRLTAYEIDGHLLASRQSPAAPPVAPQPAAPQPGAPQPAAPQPDRWPARTDLVARSLMPQLARQADCLQLATAALETRFAPLNPRRAVFPSQLWEAPAPRPPRPTDRVVIGWAGTRDERNDLALALPALAGVLDRHREVRVAILGDPELGDLLGALPVSRVSFVPGGSAERHQRFLDGIDVGLAPLAPTALNRCRGDLRFIDYAAHHVLAVCADLEPYRDVVRPGQTGFLFRDCAELETVLERVLAEPELRTAIPARAAAYASERVERRQVSERLGFYLSAAAQVGLALGASPGPRFGFPPSALLEAQHSAQSFPGSRYLALGAGKIERLLIEGLRQAREGAVDDACRTFAAAERLAPESHLPPLLIGLAASGEIAIGALARAEARNPLSCRAAHRLGELLLAAGDRAGAVAAFERARAIAPAFGAPQERLGELAEAAGHIEEACRFYEEAALQNSAFALPIARLATLAQRDGRIDKAVGLLERSLVEDPDLWLTNFLIGRSYVELKRFHQARVHLLRALDGADARAPVLTELARPEAGLGNADAARQALEEARAAKAGA
jgi:tetratricopeptide (TPR) repeat protein/glycosyltransferase involved in cell wall biosynthesis